MLTTQLALPHMINNHWGRIINVASVSVKEPLSYLALSNSIRASLVTWAKSLANDVGAYQITVNSILTGYFDTERIAQLNAKKAEQAFNKNPEAYPGLENVKTGKILSYIGIALAVIYLIFTIIYFGLIIALIASSDF